MTAIEGGTQQPRRARHSARRAARWGLRLLAGVALVNLGWDLWAWHDRQFAEGERRFWRGAEQADDIDYGLAEIRIVNETDRDYLIDAFLLDGWGGPYTHRPAAQRTLARAGTPGSVRDEERYLDHLRAEGWMALTTIEGGVERMVEFQVDRRRPVSCRIELRIREGGAEVSDCRPLHRERHDFRWLFGPPNY